MERIENLKINYDRFKFSPENEVEERLFKLTNEGLQNSIDEYYYSSLDNYKKLKNWPVVYVIEDGKHNNIYIGETQNFHMRFTQHLQSEKQEIFGDNSNIRVYFDESFNKSAILDIESELIKLAGADKFGYIVNGNRGQSIQHDYYQKFKYQHKVEQIWQKLKEQNIVRKDYIYLRNSFLYKYSPFTSLNEEQWQTCLDILTDIINNKTKRSIVVDGGAGTGKTVLAMYLLNILVNPKNENIIKEGQHILLENNDDVGEENNVYYEKLEKLLEQIYKRKYKVALVIQKESLRKTLKDVARECKMRGSIILSPAEVAKGGTYDVLIVDEAHRIKRAKNNQLMRTSGKTGIYDTYGYSKEEIDNLKIEERENLNYLHILKEKSRVLICMYDEKQTVHSSDISPESFKKELGNNYKRYTLMTQMRCQDGSGFLDFIEKLLFDNIDNTNCKFDSSYDFRIFDDVGKMVNEIRCKNKEFELCRVVAGFAWPWNTKSKKYEDIVKDKLYDIKIGQYKYIWNTEYKNWVFSKNAEKEIGFIDTIQGYDLNYVGVILGEDIKYDDLNGKIYIDKENIYYETLKRGNVTDEEIDNYIRNTYKVLMTRGIKGCYIYVCDEKLKKHFKDCVKTS